MKGLSAKGIKIELDEVHGESAPSYATHTNWVLEFKCGCSSLEDALHLGRPKSAIDDEAIRKIHEIVTDDCRKKLRRIEETPSISYDRALCVF